MIRVRILKSIATLTASYGKNAVAWLDESTARSFINAGSAELYAEHNEPQIIVQQIKPQVEEVAIVTTKKTRKKK